MRSLRVFLLLLALLFAASGCTPYDPPVQGDHAADKYRTDLQACRTSAAETVRRRNADTPWTWIRSAFAGPGEVNAGIRTCMAGKGYVLEQVGG